MNHEIIRKLTGWEFDAYDEYSLSFMLTHLPPFIKVGDLYSYLTVRYVNGRWSAFYGSQALRVTAKRPEDALAKLCLKVYGKDSICAASHQSV